MTKLRLGVIGAGSWAVAAHLPALAARPDDVEFVGVCRAGDDALARIKERFGFQVASEDYRDVLAAGVDVVVVASPTALHHEHASAALESGAHVLCEKPFTLSSKQAWDLVDTADRLDRQLLLSFGWNYAPMIERARAELAESGIGAVEHISVTMSSQTRELLANTGAYPDASPDTVPESRTWTDPAVSGGGYGQAQLSHALALAFALTGARARGAFALMSAPLGAPVELHDAICLSLEGGGICSVGGASSFVGADANKHHLAVEAIGSEGQFLVDVFRERVAVFRPGSGQTDLNVMPGEGAYDGAPRRQPAGRPRARTHGGQPRSRRTRGPDRRSARARVPKRGQRRLRDPLMKIVDVEAIPVAYPEPNDSGATRHLLFVRLTAEDGQVGWGEAVTMWPEATYAVATLVDGLAPLVAGRDPLEHALIHDALKTHTWWYGNGGLAAFAISALDIALWDLAGKSTGLSLLDLLGGAMHDRLPALVSCHATVADLDAMAATMAGWVDQHQAIGIKVGFGKRGDARLGTDASRDVAFVAALRRELGSDKAIMIDLGAAIHWDVRTAIRRTLAFEEYDIAWIEEPLGADDPDGYAELRSRVSTKIAYGEREWTPRGVERIVTTGTVDVVGVDPGRCEGITGWLAAAAHVRAAGREINAHAWSSAIVTSASLALSFAATHCHQVEIKPLRNPMQHELPLTPIQPTSGTFTPPTGAGLGVEIDEDALARYRLPR